MRIIDAAPPEKTPARRHPRAVRAARFEFLGLAAASLVVALGLWLAASNRLATTPGTPGAPGAQGGEPLDLGALRSADALVPLLDSKDDEKVRREAAQAIYRQVSAGEVPLTHVGALARVRDAAGRPVLSRAELAALKPHVAVRTRADYVRTLAMLALWMGATFWGAHLVRRWRGADDDPVLLPVLLLLSGVGVMAMVALRDPLRDMLIASTFVAGVCVGVVVLVAASEIDYESSPLRRAVLLPLGAALLLAALLLLLGSGPGRSGVKVNLFGVQPVEAIRLLVVFAMAGALARRFEHLRELSEAATPTRRWLALVKLPRWRDVRPVVASMALVLAFFFLQKDLGPALVLSGVVLALYATARGRIVPVFVGLAMLVVAFTAAYVLDFPSTVGERVRIWSDPWNNGVAGGNQVAHGLWAMATGAVRGAGLGLGSPQSIPEGHTDFVLAAIGEELGIVGVLALLALYAVLGWRCLRIAARAPGDYSALLGIGVTLALLVQGLVIAGGLFGLLPLTGVVTPFLSYGRSAMLANFAAVGVVLAVARRRGAVRLHLRQPLRLLGGALAVVAVAVASRAAWIQVVRADELATAASLSVQADEGYRFEYNPRLVEAARAMERGSIYDRNGLVLATSRPAEMAGVEAAYAKAGVAPVARCAPDLARCYPLGGVGFSVLGDWERQTNWGARNASYLERERDAVLKGFDDRQRLVPVVHPRTGASSNAVRRDYGALLPVVRHGAYSPRPEVRLLLDRPRNLTASIDARLQQRVARALADGIAKGAHARGAAVVIDVETGDVLAAVSYPWPSDLAGVGAVGEGVSRALATPGTAATAVRASVARSSPARDADRDAEAMLDRVRYGLYPPGSTFKLLVASAALRSQPEVQSQTFMCTRLPGGRVGNHVRGWSRPIRDDVKDTVPHGAVDLHRGLVVSCNAYFAQLAMALGPGPILDAASVFQIDAARPATRAALGEMLPHAGYGQGEVLASPLKMARVAAAIAAGGVVRPVRWTVESAAVPARQDPKGDGGVAAVGEPVRFLSEADAAKLARYLREAVTSGTGRSLASNATPIAGKTGTAEVDRAASHSWFVGYAPYGGARPIAFAVIVENAGYGARSAAPVAGAIVDAAK